MKLRGWPAPPAIVLVAASVVVLAVGPAAAQPTRPKPPRCPVAQKLCGASCVPTDAAHGCGGPACGPCIALMSHVDKPVCTRADAGPTRCGYSACQPAWIDEDGDPSNGCEIQQLASVSIEITDPYQVTRRHQPGSPTVLYYVWQPGTAALTAVTMTSESREVHREGGVWLIVPADQEDDLRLCLDRPFRRLDLTVPPGEHGLRNGVTAPMDGGVVEGIAVDRATVTCLRTFEPPPPAT